MPYCFRARIILTDRSDGLVSHAVGVNGAMCNIAECYIISNCPVTCPWADEPKGSQLLAKKSRSDGLVSAQRSECSEAERYIIRTVQSRRPQQTRPKEATKKGHKQMCPFRCDPKGVACVVVEMRFIQPNTVF